MLSILVLAVTAFASTNIDDIFVLLGFFSDQSYRPFQVVVGQCLGMACLVGASLICALVSLVIPSAYIGFLGILPIVTGGRKLWTRPQTDDEHHISGGPSGKVLSVAAVTIANGGDNIGTYVPLFATMNGVQLTTTIIVFALMTALWCISGRWFVHHRTLGTFIGSWGHRVLPFVLIALGCYILWRAGSLALLAGVFR